MKLSVVAENTTRRDFLKKGITTVISANPLLKILSTSGIPSTIITGLNSGESIPFFITVVGNHGRGLPPKLSSIFNNIIKAATLSSRLSDSGLIMGSDDNFSIGGKIGIEKLASIANAASTGSVVELAGRDYRVSDDGDAFVLDAAHKGSNEPDIIIYKDPDPDYYETLIGNPIKAVWDEYLKHGGCSIDKAAQNLIRDLDLDMSHYFSHDDNVEHIKDTNHNQNSTRSQELEPMDNRFGNREYHGTMHQIYDNYNNKLNIVLDSIFRQNI